MSFTLGKRFSLNRRNGLLNNFNRVALVLSRNFAHVPFSSSIYFSPLWEEEVKKRAKEVYSFLARRGFSWVELSSSSKELELLSWVFPQLLSDSSGKILIHRGNLGAIINYQDHLSLFVEGEYQSLEPYWKKLNKWDDFWEGKLEYAYSEELGYLTSSPSRLGTGFKIYMRLHLPALSFIYGEEKVFQWFKDSDKFSVEVYGENNQALAHLFVFSNLFTLGVKEIEILKTIQDFGRGVWEWEKQARASLVKSSSRQDIFRQMMECLWKELIEENEEENEEQNEKKFLDFVSFWLLAQSEGILPESWGFQFMKTIDLWGKVMSGRLLRGQSLKVLGFLGIELGRIWNDV